MLKGNTKITNAWRITMMPLFGGVISVILYVPMKKYLMMALMKNVGAKKLSGVA